MKLPFVLISTAWFCRYNDLITNYANRKLHMDILSDMGLCEEEILFIPPIEILCIETDTRYSRIYCLHTKKPFLSSLRISEIEKLFPMESFCDVHRSYIVNLYHRKTMNKTMTRIYFAGGIVVHVSGDRVDEYLQKMANL